MLKNYILVLIICICVTGELLEEMHGNRRRKKRPTYGVRTVEITKGKKGFGFTITGDAPCILKCIVTGSPAERAGLKPGDYLIAVNGTNVSKVPHDAVACLIGLSNLLKLQIAENYFSDSSDDEFPVNRPKPKYPNRLRHKNQQTRAEKVVCDLQSGAIFSEHAAIHMSETAFMSDRDWPENFPSNPPNPPPAAPPPPRVLPKGPPPNVTTPSTSPTRLHPDQMRLMTVDTRQSSRTPRPTLKEEPPQHLPRLRHSPKKKEKLQKGKNQQIPDNKEDLDSQIEPPQQHYQYQQQAPPIAHKKQQLHTQCQPRSHQLQQHLSQLSSHPPHPQHPVHSQPLPLPPHSQQHATYPPHSSHPNHSQLIAHSQHLTHPPLTQHQPMSHQSISHHQSISQHQNLSQHQPSLHQSHTSISQHQAISHPSISQHQSISHPSISQHQSVSHPSISQHQSVSHPSISQHQSVVLPSISQHQSVSHQSIPQHQAISHHQAISQHQSHIHHQKLSQISIPPGEHQVHYNHIQLRQSQHQNHPKPHHMIQHQQPLQQSQHNHLQQHTLHQITQQQKQQPQDSCHNAVQVEGDVYNVGITEQEINNLLYPTLAELQQQAPPQEAGESLYRAVVGYLGTIEMPKEPQGGSRLTAIRNCIRRLRIEKKVHTLVLMSVFTERVVLTNPHGLTLAQYPAERITFCGVYADDKKFFGLVTIHGTSSDELSDASQDGDMISTTTSSSCHVFMVDPRMVQHSDHARRAKNFRIECSLAPDDMAGQCLEFPDSADPILHAIMSLYRNRVGFHLDTGAPGLIDVEAQMSPQHSNTSSNSSNSDSGIGFRDEGGHHYHQNDRVIVVEVDDNQRMHIQNYQTHGNMRLNCNENLRSNMENIRASVDNHRANLTVSLANSVNTLVSESSDSGPAPNTIRTNLNITERNTQSANNLRAINTTTADKFRANLNESNSSKVLDNVRVNMNDNYHINVANNNNNNNNNINTNSSYNNADNLRASVSDSKRLNDIRASIAENSRLAKVNGRTSMTDDLRAALKENARQDGRTSITDEILGKRDSPIGGYCSPVEADRLNVRAMPDPISFERAPGFLSISDTPVHVASMRHSMHKYLQHKQEHLVKVSQKINRRESDVIGLNPLSVRAFSPSTTKQKTSPTPVSATANTQDPLDLELSLKLSPKVYGLPMRSSAPSERSFTRSLEDLRDSSTSDGVVGSSGLGGGNGSFRDGSESDHGLDRLRNVQLTPLARLLHVSETNLTRYGPVGGYGHETHRGAFRAVPPRSHRIVHSSPLVRGVGLVTSMNRPSDSGDEHTETTENTGDQEGSQDVHPPTEEEFSHSDLEQVSHLFFSILFVFISF